MRGGEIISGKSNKPSKKKQLISLFDILENGYLDRYNIVNHCIVWEFFNSRFARSFFNLFTNITQLELYSCNTKDYDNHSSINETVGSNKVLIEALYPLKNLEFLKIGSQLINSSVSCSKLFFKLPLSLKILHVIECKSSYGNLNFYPIENINEEYLNLKEVSIINNKMLSNLAARMETLTDVTISNQQDLNISSLDQFLLLNPQLKKLTVPVYFLECRLVTSILQMQQLKNLNIKYSLYGEQDAIYNLPVNTSIKHLNISSYISSDRLIFILNNLESLKVLEFSNNSFYNIIDINFSACANRIPLLHLNGLKYTKDAIYSFDNPEIFDRIRFTNMIELEYYLTAFEEDALKNWNICHFDSTNSEDFTIVNMSNSG
jgi:hypothetical protein